MMKRPIYLSLLILGLSLGISTNAFAAKKQKEEEQPASKSKSAEKNTPPAVREAGEADLKVRAIQKELREIIERTRDLQKQAQTDRAEIDQILTRAKIHQQILEKMKQPETVQAVSPKDLSRIVEREKLRLISEQAERSRREISQLEETRMRQGFPVKGSSEAKTS